MVTKKEREEMADEAERELIIKQHKAGRYMARVRDKTTISKVAADLGCSNTLLGYIEKGQRVPSDHFLNEWAAYFGVDETSLYNLWGKIPILAKDEIRNSDTLKGTLLEIARNKKLSAEEKEEIYDEIHKTYKRYLIRKEGK
jgi:transcriptional regulator with XRE-family HTH domain